MVRFGAKKVEAIPPFLFSALQIIPIFFWFSTSSTCNYGKTPVFLRFLSYPLSKKVVSLVETQSPLLVKRSRNVHEHNAHIQRVALHF